jgi:Homeodomain-like domain
MPWLEATPMEQRERFIRDHADGLYTMTELCARHTISRKTGYKWLERFDEGGRAALGDRSRAPLHCPHRMAAEVADLICGARRHHPSWGPEKLLHWLTPRHRGVAWPAIWAESPDRVLIFSRGCLPELKDDRGAAQNIIPERNASGYDLSRKDPARQPRWDHIVNFVDRNGRLIESWEQHNKPFVRPHRVLVSPYDPERHIRLVDDGAQMIYKFTRDGKKLVMQLGEFRVAGNDEKHFARPTDIAWLPDGTFFVSDGYTNSRVVKFDPNGKFLLTWG